MVKTTKKIYKPGSKKYNKTSNTSTSISISTSTSTSTTTIPMIYRGVYPDLDYRNRWDGSPLIGITLVVVIIWILA